MQGPFRSNKNTLKIQTPQAISAANTATLAQTNETEVKQTNIYRRYGWNSTLDWFTCVILGEVEVCNVICGTVMLSTISSIGSEYAFLEACPGLHSLHARSTEICSCSKQRKQKRGCQSHCHKTLHCHKRISHRKVYLRR